MLSLLLLILFLYFAITYWPLALFFLIAFIAFLIFACFQKNTSSTKTEDTNTTPKIGASVSRAFHDEAWSYCNRHHMTMSDLIRKAVKKYMDEND